MDFTNPDRREFLDGLVRACLFGGLTATGTVLVWRWWQDGACWDGGRCDGCRIVAACPLRRRNDEVQS